MDERRRRRRRRGRRRAVPVAPGPRHSWRHSWRRRRRRQRLARRAKHLLRPQVPAAVDAKGVGRGWFRIGVHARRPHPPQEGPGRGGGSRRDILAAPVAPGGRGRGRGRRGRKPGAGAGAKKPSPPPEPSESSSSPRTPTRTPTTTTCPRRGARGHATMALRRSRNSRGRRRRGARRERARHRASPLENRQPNRPRP